MHPKMGDKKYTFFVMLLPIIARSMHSKLQCVNRAIFFVFYSLFSTHHHHANFTVHWSSILAFCQNCFKTPNWRPVIRLCLIMWHERKDWLSPGDEPSWKIYRKSYLRFIIKSYFFKESSSQIFVRGTSALTRLNKIYSTTHFFLQNINYIFSNKEGIGKI